MVGASLGTVDPKTRVQIPAPALLAEMRMMSLNGDVSLLEFQSLRAKLSCSEANVLFVNFSADDCVSVVPSYA